MPKTCSYSPGTNSPAYMSCPCAGTGVLARVPGLSTPANNCQCASMYLGWRHNNWIAWAALTLAIVVDVILLIVGAAGGWGCKLTCTEDSDDAVLVNEGIYTCGGGAISALDRSTARALMGLPCAS